MTSLPAPLWNQIAETQELETEAAKTAFRLNPEQLAQMSDHWDRLETAAGTPSKVISCLLTVLPLLLESAAIAGQVSQTPELRSALPEVNSPEEAATLMQMEWRLTPAEKTTLTAALSSPASQERWLKAAQMASRHS